MTAHEVAKLDDIPGRGGLLVTVGGLEIGLFRVGTTVRAWRNHCPHMAAPVCRGTVTGTLLASAVYEYTPAATAKFCSAHGTAGSSTCTAGSIWRPDHERASAAIRPRS